MSTTARREQHRLLGLRRAVHYRWPAPVLDELNRRFADVMVRESEVSPASILAAVERGLRRAMHYTMVGAPPAPIRSPAAVKAGTTPKVKA